MGGTPPSSPSGIAIPALGSYPSARLRYSLISNSVGHFETSPTKSETLFTSCWWIRVCMAEGALEGLALGSEPAYSRFKQAMMRFVQVRTALEPAAPPPETLSLFGGRKGKGKGSSLEPVRSPAPRAEEEEEEAEHRRKVLPSGPPPSAIQEDNASIAESRLPGWPCSRRCRHRACRHRLTS